MSELKTLKDMPEALSTVEHPFKEWATWDFIEKILRQEAIKWIKYHQEVIKSCDWERDKILVNGKIMVLMSFFNLTEEDLK